VPQEGNKKEETFIAPLAEIEAKQKRKNDFECLREKNIKEMKLMIANILNVTSFIFVILSKTHRARKTYRDHSSLLKDKWKRAKIQSALLSFSSSK